MTNPPPPPPGARATRPLRAVLKAAVFFLKVFPMIPSRAVDWVTPRPRVDRVRYPTLDGWAEGELYRPAAGGPHPGMVVCLGVVPFGVDHPQVPVLGKALARAGIAALLYWSPAMRDFRLDPADVENIALAYDWLVEQPTVDPARSGLLGTCVGGSFALMAAASPRIRERVSYVAAYAPFSSLWTFARDIASGSTQSGPPGEEERSPRPTRAVWKVDPLTRKVFVHSLTAWLEPGEAARLRAEFAEPEAPVGPEHPPGSGIPAGYTPPGGSEPPGDRAMQGQAGQPAGSAVPERGPLSEQGQAIHALLNAPDADAAESALRRLPPAEQERLSAISPLAHLAGLRAPRIVLLHDQGDQVIPVGESRQLVAALAGRAALAGQEGVQYTEMQFSHLDPVKGKLPFFRLLRELGKFFRAVYPIFRQMA